MPVCDRRRRRSARTLADLPLTCTQAFERALRYLRTTLAVLVDPVAPRLGTPTPISSIRPLDLHDFRRAGLRRDVSPSIRIEWTTSSTSSGFTEYRDALP